ILPFEVPFFEDKHHFKIHYVGNPTVEEVDSFLASYEETREDFCLHHSLDPSKRIIALLAGSRRQEIKDNLPAMIEAARPYCEGHAEHQMVIAGAPSIDNEFYQTYISGNDVKKVDNETYALLRHAEAALVTSGTATLETALFDVPQVVCYKTPLPHLARLGFDHIIQCKYISLVNLVADQEIVQELMADRFSVKNVHDELGKILLGQKTRDTMLQAYQEVHARLGHEVAPENAARIMVSLLRR
ncbi:MAG: lipid-A-disaccharide synthase, partial [Bacteroidota bacterium]|nr:lipid-A-disaccharide synthase [Bacteroidota bacterium]